MKKLKTCKIDLGQLKDLQELINKLEAFSNDNCLIEVNAKIGAKDVTFIIERNGEDYKCIVDTISMGITTCQDFFSIIDLAKLSNWTLESKQEPWLTPEVMTGLLKVKEKIKSLRISNSMRKTNKTLGRPSNVDKINEAIELYKTSNYTVEDIVNKTGVSKTTLYRHLKKNN